MTTLGERLERRRRRRAGGDYVVELPPLDVPPEYRWPCDDRRAPIFVAVVETKKRRSGVGRSGVTRSLAGETRET